MKTAKGLGLLAGVLSLLIGFSLALNYVWVFVFISIGLWREVSWPLSAPLWFLILNMVIYVPLGVWMILDKRRDFFLFAVAWAIIGSALGAYLGFSTGSFLNLLYFLLVFSSTYYYVSKVNTAASRQTRMLAGVLALAQGAYLALAFFFVSLMASSQARNPLAMAGIVNPLGISLAVSMVVYVLLGVGIIKGKREFLFYAVLATILESALATLTIFFTRGGFYNLLSMLTLFLSTYCYWAKTKT